LLIRVCESMITAPELNFGAIDSVAVIQVQAVRRRHKPVLGHVQLSQRHVCAGVDMRFE
jgi:hypothetical protein